MRRDQHRLERQPDRRLERVAAGAGRVEDGQQPLDLGVLDRPAERPVGEGPHHPLRGVPGRQVLPRFGDEQLLAGGRVLQRGVEDAVGGGEVLLDVDGGGEQGLAVGVEPLAAGAVGREGGGRLQVEPDEVADGVVVLGPGEPPAHDVAAVVPLGPVGGDGLAVRLLLGHRPQPRGAACRFSLNGTSLAPGGGISKACTRSTTSAHRAGSLAASAWVLKVERSSPPFFFAGPWHSPQYLVRIGRTFLANGSSGGACAAATRARASGRTGKAWGMGRARAAPAGGH